MTQPEHIQENSLENPHAFLSYLEKHKSLPPLSDNQFKKLQGAMTQEEILQTYRLIDDIGGYDNADRQRVLDTWYPRPKVLYHASKSGTINVFEPTKETHRHKDDPPQVFAAPSEQVAAMFFVNENYISSGTYDHGRTWSVIIGDEKDFREKDRGGYIYELPPEQFITNPNYGLGLFEWQSTENVIPTSKKFFPSGLDAMLELNVSVYFLSHDEYEKFLHTDSLNQKEFLKRKTPYIKEGY